MRFDLRLHGRTKSGKECVMELTVYAASQKQLEERAMKGSEEGPLYVKGTNEPVSETDPITVKRVEQLGKKRGGKHRI